MNKLYMEEVNKMVCIILDIVEEFVQLDSSTEDALFARLQVYIDDVAGRGEYRGLN